MTKIMGANAAEMLLFRGFSIFRFSLCALIACWLSVGPQKHFEFFDLQCVCSKPAGGLVTDLARWSVVSVEQAVFVNQTSKELLGVQQ